MTSRSRPSRAGRDTGGFTLVELMAGLAVGSAVVVTALATLALPLREATAAQREARAAEDLRSAELLLHRLLRQAVPAPTGEPGLQLDDGDTVLRARTVDADGTVRAIAWRLVEGALAMRFDGGSWQMLTDPQVVRLRGLRFTLDAPSPAVPPAPGVGCAIVDPPVVRWRFEHRPAVGAASAWTAVDGQVRVRHRWVVGGCG